MYGKVNFNVSTQANAYAVGYREGMRDIANVLANGGIEAVEEWLRNNYVK